MTNTPIYSTHNFLPTCDTYDYSYSQRSIAFYDFFPRVLVKFISEKVTPYLIQAEKEFESEHYQVVCDKKKSFNSEKNAEQFIRSFIRSARNQKVAIRYYKCKVCDKFHTTSGKRIPAKHFYLEKRAAHLFVYATNTAIIVDSITGEKIHVSYKVKHDSSSNNNNLTVEKIKAYIGDDKETIFKVDARNMVKGHSDDIRDNSLCTTVVNSANLVIPSEKHKNVHRFVGWLSLVSHDQQLFYACVEDRDGNNGVVILPASGEGQIFIAQLYNVDNIYKLRLAEAKTTLSNNGDMSFSIKQCRTNFRPISEYFVMDKTKMHSRLEELNH